MERGRGGEGSPGLSRDRVGNPSPNCECTDSLDII